MAVLRLTNLSFKLIVVDDHVALLQMYKVVHQLNGFDDPGVENARPHKQYGSVLDVNELVGNGGCETERL